MPEPDPKPATAKREPNALSSEYHKAHKQLMLWATILLIWELIGVDLGKAKDAGGNIGPIVTALKSPQAVPWALLGLVGYFLFKCSIEWGQCHPDRKAVRYAKIDFIAAWAVSLAATILYIWQTISRIQVANVVSSGSGPSILTGMSAGSLLCAAILTSIRNRGDIDRIVLIIVGIFAGSGLLAIVGFFLWGRSWSSGIAGFLFGATVIFLISPTAFDLYSLLWQRAKLGLTKS